MRKNTNGFTIIELLIVIVVIAILAVITLVAYNGIQGRARDDARYAEVKNIIKALELYKVDNGSYPPTSASPSGNGCTGIGYSFSWATDGTWMQPLVSGGYMTTAPTPPINDCTHFIRYLHPAANAYGCSSRTTSYYILQVQGIDNTFTPPEAVSGTWSPCTGATASWSTNSTTWTFEKDDS